MPQKWRTAEMKTKCAFWIAGAGVLLGTVLRCIQMLFFFDYETGFVTDSGTLTILYSGATLLSALAAGLLCFLDRGRCGVLRPVRSWPAGITSLLAGVFLLLCAVALLWDAHAYRAFGVSYFVLPAQVQSHVPFAVFTVLFGAAAAAAAVLWMRGGAFPGKSGALWALGVVWGLSYMLLTFMLYSASATTVENLYTVGGGAAMLLFLLAEGKLLSGVGGQKAARTAFVFGLPAAVFWLTYVVSNTVLIVAGRGYATEMPYVIQLAMLAVCVHILALLFSLRGEIFALCAPEHAPAHEKKPGFKAGSGR